MAGLTWLTLAVGLFALSHLLLAAAAVRIPLVARIGEAAFRAAYSVLALALLVWVVHAYRTAPVIDLWHPPTALRHLSLTIMPLACILLIAGVSTPNPTAMGTDPSRVAARGPVGITKITRHPVMWAIGLWGILHLLANGDAAGTILFGGMTALALGGAVAQEKKKRRLLGPAWDGFARQTSHLPFLAIVQKRTRVSLGEIGYARLVGGIALYGVLLATHGWLIGVNPVTVG